LPQSAGTPAKPAFGLAGIRALCIDNDPRILDGMRLLLEGWGCVVETIAGSAAIDAANRPDIVLADYHLDRETGLEAIEKARAVFGMELAAVLVTADRSPEVKAASAALDVPVLNKPVKPAALRSAMARVRRVAEAAE
jgi:CheY-like chemotaxis protein